MKKFEKLYFRTSIIISIAALAMLIPAPYNTYIWGKGHGGGAIILLWTLLSFILGIIGVVLVLIAKRKKRNFDKLVIGTVLSSSFFIVAGYLRLFW
ncbi:MAG: hypothetical protein KDC83_14970 [Flavobacteriales bacterium]|nr:hypothetical protein [Flavobacteriales bacterium]